MQADIRIVSLPAGNDPDKIIREDPSRWPALLAAAKPVVAYVIDTYVEHARPDGSQGEDRGGSEDTAADR